MKHALIDEKEDVYSLDGVLLGKRVADTSETAFQVAPPLFWVECAEEVRADEFYWDGETIQPKPAPPLAPAQEPPASVDGGPNVIA